MTTWFGNTTQNTSGAFGINTLNSNKHTATATGNVTAAHHMAQGHATLVTKLKVVIYADSAGVPGARLGASDELTLAAGSAMSLRTFTFSTPVAVVSGTPYWLVIFGGDANWNAQYNTSGTLYYRAGQTYASGPPDPFGTASTAPNLLIYLEAGIEPPASTFVPRVMASY